jgi:hypothetical protein
VGDGCADDVVVVGDDEGLVDDVATDDVENIGKPEDAELAAVAETDVDSGLKVGIVKNESDCNEEIVAAELCDKVDLEVGIEPIFDVATGKLMDNIGDESAELCVKVDLGVDIEPISDVARGKLVDNVGDELAKLNVKADSDADTGLKSNALVSEFKGWPADVVLDTNVADD